jgi:chromosome segregation ATPase
MRNKNTFKISVFAALIAVFVFGGVMAKAQNRNPRSVESVETAQNTDDATSTEDESEEQNTEARRKNEQERAQKAQELRRKGQINAIKRLMANQINRATRAISRMSNILDRIESRSEKLAGNGVDVSEFEDLIKAAQDQEAEAVATVEKLKSDWSALQETSENPRPTVQQFMTSANMLKRQVIEFHRSLMAIVKAMRQAVSEDEDDNETSGPTPSPSPTPVSTPTPIYVPTPSTTPTPVVTPTEVDTN